MKRGEWVIIMENSGPWDKQDFCGRVGEYLSTDYGSAVVEIVGESTKIICKPENLVKVSAVPRIFEALSEALEWLENHAYDESDPGVMELIEALETAVETAKE